MTEYEMDDMEYGFFDSFKSRYCERTKKPRGSRSYERRWDHVVRAICSGCGKTLSLTEGQRGLAFCYDCRRVLFPETLPSKKSYRKELPRRRLTITFSV